MKVLLRDEDAHLYYGTQDLWVADPNAAMDFGALERAGREAFSHPTQTLAIVLRYDNPECELALNPAFCFSARRTTTQAE